MLQQRNSSAARYILKKDLNTENNTIESSSSVESSVREPLKSPRKSHFESVATEVAGGMYSPKKEVREYLVAAELDSFNTMNTGDGPLSLPLQVSKTIN